MVLSRGRVEVGRFGSSLGMIDLAFVMHETLVSQPLDARATKRTSQFDLAVSPRARVFSTMDGRTFWRSYVHWTAGILIISPLSRIAVR
jgi:hypothetical protein